MDIDGASLGRKASLGRNRDLSYNHTCPRKGAVRSIDKGGGKVHRLITELFNVSVGVDVSRYPRMAISRHDNYSLGVVRLTVPNALIMWEKTKDDIRVVGVSVRS